jgi:BASS family bile acid:Na+ symporter
VALSISLTVINGILSLFTIPLLTSLALTYFISSGAEIHLPILNTFLNLSFVSIIPAVIGMSIRQYRPGFALSLRPLLRILLPLLLLFIFGIKFFAPIAQGGVGLTFEEIYLIAPYVLILNAVSMLSGYLAGSLFNLRHKNKVTIIIEIGLQNTGLALFIAGTILHNTEMQKPAMVYAILTFVSTFLFAWIIREATKPGTGSLENEE